MMPAKNAPVPTICQPGERNAMYGLELGDITSMTAANERHTTGSAVGNYPMGNVGAQTSRPVGGDDR